MRYTCELLTCSNVFLHIRPLVLDYFIVFFFSVLQKKAMGSFLYEQVFYNLDIIEKDYFGLQFTDANHVKHWLDPTKPIKKQVKSKCLNLWLRDLS